MAAKFTMPTRFVVCDVLNETIYPTDQRKNGLAAPNANDDKR